eukprot:scaffold13938_cov21-Tisochrysis_lutea.AAC.1
MLHRQSLSYNRNTLGPGSVGFTPPWPTLSRLGKGTRSWSGNVKSLPSVHPNAHARSACHSSGNYSLSESSNLLDIEHKLVLDERHSFSGSVSDIDAQFCKFLAKLSGTKTSNVVQYTSAHVCVRASGNLPFRWGSRCWGGKQAGVTCVDL